MTKPASLRLALLPAAFAALLALAGCGIKGPLELPPEAKTTANAGKAKGEVPLEKQLPGYRPSAQEKKAAKQLGKPVRSDDPFILDPLLK